MKTLLISMAFVGFLVAAGSAASATNPFRVAWKRYYVDSGNSDTANTLRTEVKCSVCHLDRERKDKLNDYGVALLDNGLSIANFPRERFEREPETVQKEIEEIFKKTERTNR